MSALRPPTPPTPGWRERALVLGAKLCEALRGVWLAVLAFFLVRLDPFGRARAPIPLSIGAGAGRRAASVCLVQGQSLRALRVAALFWRHYGHDWSLRRLAALAASHGLGGEPLAVAGVLFPGGPPGENPPHAFVVSFDLELGTVALQHAAGEEGGVCVHPPARVALQAASLGDVLRPLVGRRPCPATPSWLVAGAYPRPSNLNNKYA